MEAMSAAEAWIERLLDNATVMPRALREFSKLNPDIPWQQAAEVLRARLEHGKPYRRQGWQPRIELVTGTSVPLDCLEVQIGGRQVAKIRKDRLGESQVASVRRIGSIRNADPASRLHRHRPSRRLVA
jgi:hypothetical protein